MKSKRCLRIGHVKVSKIVTDLASFNEIHACLLKHSSYDWGDLSPDEKARVQEELRCGNPVTSAHEFWVRFRLRIETIQDTASTSVMLEEEYRNRDRKPVKFHEPSLLADLVNGPHRANFWDADESQEPAPPSPLITRAASVRCETVEHWKTPRASLEMALGPEEIKGMEAEEDHNGYATYETWAAAVWLDSEGANQDYWIDAAREANEGAAECSQVREGIWDIHMAPVFLLANRLKKELTEAMPKLGTGFYSDLLMRAFSKVVWHQLAEDFLAAEFGRTPF